MARRLNVRLAVHQKVDTGMGRNGFAPEEIDAVLDAVDRSASLDVEGLYTHLAAADEPDDKFTREQLARFEHLAARIAAQGRSIRYLHATNSAGLARYDLPHLTLARPGIALYGYQSNTGSQGEPPLPLAPVLRLTARLALLRDLPAGCAIGYGSTWTTRRPSRIGLLPIGYGDGYNRRFGNLAVMQIRGRDVPVVGRISMDLTTLDLTDLPGGGRDVRVGDEVTVISERPGDSNSVEGLARLAGTIPYEITCQIGTRVRRELVESFGQPA
jgi:alanine racemase